VPPVRIETERLILRRYEPSDLDALRHAVDVSLDAIRPWMPNASRELSGDLREWLDMAASQFDTGERFPYGLFTRSNGTFVGHVSAIPDEDGAIVLGYWAHAGHLRHGFVSEAVRALVDAGLGQRYVINCSPDNLPSMGVARTCGFTPIETRTLRHEDREFEEVRWELIPTPPD
jgi:RimJ/RimL family protein N-acetyltransferase